MNYKISLLIAVCLIWVFLLSACEKEEVEKEEIIPGQTVPMVCIQAPTENILKGIIQELSSCSTSKNIVDFEWIIQRGSVFNSSATSHGDTLTGKEIKYAFPSYGDYIIRLKVTSEDQLSSTTFANITVEEDQYIKITDRLEDLFRNISVTRSNSGDGFVMIGAYTRNFTDNGNYFIKTNNKLQLTERHELKIEPLSRTKVLNADFGYLIVSNTYSEQYVYYKLDENGTLIEPPLKTNLQFRKVISAKTSDGFLSLGETFGNYLVVMKMDHQLENNTYEELTLQSNGQAEISIKSSFKPLGNDQFAVLVQESENGKIGKLVVDKNMDLLSEDWLDINIENEIIDFLVDENELGLISKDNAGDLNVDYLIDDKLVWNYQINAKGYRNFFIKKSANAFFIFGGKFDLHKISTGGNLVWSRSFLDNTVDLENLFVINNEYYLMGAAQWYDPLDDRYFYRQLIGYILDEEEVSSY